MTVDIEARGEDRKVAGWLLHVDERRADYLARRETAITVPSPQLDKVGGRGSSISDPTAAAAGAGYDPDTERWLALVEEVEGRLPTKMLVYLRLRRKYRYNVGRRGWVAQIQREYPEEMSRITGKKVEIVWVDSRNTFGNWWRLIVGYAARLAAKRGLLG